MSSYNNTILPNFTARFQITGETYNSICWSPDGEKLALASDHHIDIWQPTLAGNSLLQIRRTFGVIQRVVWSQDSEWIAVRFSDMSLHVWSTISGDWKRMLDYRHVGKLEDFIWHEDATKLLLAFSGSRVYEWELQIGSLTEIFNLPDYYANENFVWSNSPDRFVTFRGDELALWSRTDNQLFSKRAATLQENGIVSVAWSSDARLLATGFKDGTIGIWDTESFKALNLLEGHTDSIRQLSFSPDNQFLCSIGQDRSIRLWYVSWWQCVATVFSESLRQSFSFNPRNDLIAILAGDQNPVAVGTVEYQALINSVSHKFVHYSNAKVVLVGDSGVGKSGLGLVLSGQTFHSTDSTHGKFVWTFSERLVALKNGLPETQETLLWDLAGQPGYRLIHQLHLNEVSVALVVFDAKSETDPFAGVKHWDKALRQAQFRQGQTAPHMHKLLVAARIDRGSIGVSRPRIEALIREMGFDGYFETSAREGWGIEELRNAISNLIDWQELPRVSSSELFQQIKGFLTLQKEAGRVLSTVDDQFHAFLRSSNIDKHTPQLREQFETCIGRVESRGLIKRLSFGNLLLLQPELLDAYASAIVNAAKEEPDGLGSISEEDAREGRFRMSTDERLPNAEEERLLLIATVEDLLRHDIALRQQAEEGPYLVFPAQLTRENPDLPDPAGKAIIFTFEGPLLNIYSTLAVRLSHSGIFKKKNMWKNATTYSATKGVCGIFLREIEEGRGELALFYDEDTSQETRLNFEKYVESHLMRRSLPDSLKRRRVFVCVGCGFVVNEQLFRLRTERGHNHLNCPVCERHISLTEEYIAIQADVVQKMDTEADARRDEAMVMSTLPGKRLTNDFDVFLCHNSADKAAVKKIGEDLTKRGILPWLDEWELRPGMPWQRSLEEQIEKIKSAAVFVGKKGIGPWQNMELDAFLREFVRRGCPVIPVLLKDAPKKPQLPTFLKGMTWVDFRRAEPEPLQQLIWGITGSNPNSIP